MRLSPRVRTFLLFFGLQFAAYFNITLDMIAVNREWYGVASVTNLLAPMIAWVMVVLIGENKKDRVGLVAVMLGGWTSTMVGMWVANYVKVP